MKRKGLLVIAAAHVLLISSFAHADTILFKFSNDVCDTVDGKWTGTGKVSVGAIKCVYNGTAMISGTPDNLGLDVTLNKTSGICPAQEHIQLSGGTCHQGVIALHTPNVANLDGNLDASGTKASVTGNVTFELLGKEVTANVDEMDLSKS